MNKTVIIQGSSRSGGDTNKIVNYMASKNTIDVIDLHNKNIGHYDYEYKNKDDDDGIFIYISIYIYIYIYIYIDK